MEFILRNVQHLPFGQQSESDTSSTLDSYTTARDMHTVPMMQSVAQTSNAQQMPQNPEVQLTTPTSLASLHLTSPPAAAYDFQSLEITNLANFLTSALQNMRNDSIRKKALINIQQSILQYATEDLQSQINGAQND